MGRYVVLELIGRGGMGVVYAAYDPQLDRKVAVKLVDAHGGRRSGMHRVRLLREAQALARLAHPNVVTVHDVGTLGEDVFVAMEFLAGRTLTQWLALEERSWAEIVDVFVQAGRGLAAAHAAGLVHRDFKPDNVIITDDRRVVVLDFGLARQDRAAPSGGEEIVSAAESMTRIEGVTLAGSLVGTPRYMSPEQFLGADVTAASDQFSFCVAMWSALHGKPPFASDLTLTGLRTSVLAGKPPSPPPRSAVPSWLTRALTRGLARQPSQRHATMEELLEALQPREGRRRRMLALGGLGALALAAGLGAWWSASRTDPCATDDGAVARAWNGERRGAIEAAFGRDTRPLAADALERVVSRLDAYVERLDAQRSAACVAARDGTVSTHAASEWAACLDRRVARLDSLAAIFTEPSRKVIDAASTAVESLADPESCREAKGSRDDLPMPEDPELRRQVEAIRMSMLDLERFKLEGRFEEAARSLDGWIAQAREIGHPPLVAALLLERAHTAVQLGDFSRVKQLASEALLIGAEAGFDWAIAEALTSLGRAELKLAGVESAEMWMRLALAVASRLEQSAFRANALTDLAHLEMDRGEHGRAETLLLEALDAFGEDSHSGRVVTYDVLGVAQLNQERHHEAYATLQRGLELAHETLGEAHPIVGNLLVHRCQVSLARDQEHVEAAVEDCKAAQTIIEAAYSGPHPSLAAAIYWGSEAQMAAGQFDDAIASLENLLAMQSDVPQGRTSQVMIVYAQLGRVQRAAGRPEDAIETYRNAVARFGPDAPIDATAMWQVQVGWARAELDLGDAASARRRCADLIEEIEHLRGPDHAHLFPALVVRAQAGLALGELNPAIADVERALALKGEGEEEDEERALARFTLARALERTGTRLDEAASSRRAALDAWQRRPRYFARELERARAEGPPSR